MSDENPNTAEDMTKADTTKAAAEAQKLLPEEVENLTRLHRQAQELVQTIGQMEVRKAGLLTSLSDVQEKAQGLMNAAASRLGIAPGTPWQMTPDGTVVILPSKNLQTAPTH